VLQLLLDVLGLNLLFLLALSLLLLLSALGLLLLRSLLLEHQLIELGLLVDLHFSLHFLDANHDHIDNVLVGHQREIPVESPGRRLGQQFSAQQLHSAFE